MPPAETGPPGPEDGVPEGIEVRVFARTDVGQIREHNEDDFLVADLGQEIRTLMPEVQTHRLGPRGSIFVVCDGMGGAAAGEVASRTAVDTICERMRAGEPPASWADLVSRLDNAIIEAGSRIFRMARADHERRGMGTTCTAATLIDGRLFVAQVGDSRCYVVRGTEMIQVSRDQSLLTQLIEAGQIRPADAPNFEHSNIILQALGTTEMINTDVTFVDLRRGDTVLLCSDGLAGMVEDDAIREALLANPEPVVACRALTDLANAAGGEDNITAVVVRFGGADLPPPGADERVAFARYPKPRPTAFDRVPYTIPEQLFSDGLTVAPRRPDVPAGAVRIDGLGQAPDDAAGAEPPKTAPTRVPEAVREPPAQPPPPVEAPAAAADSPPPLEVLEWSDEDLDLGDLPSERDPRPPDKLKPWAIAAFLLLAIIVAVILWESAGCGRGPSGESSASLSAGAAEVASDADPR